MENDGMLAFNIQPISDEFGPFDGMMGYTPYFELEAPEEEWDLKPIELPEHESTDSEPFKRVKFDEHSCRSAHTVNTEDLFKEGYDDIIYEGDLMKFKPGLSNNFVSRYV